MKQVIKKKLMSCFYPAQYQCSEMGVATKFVFVGHSVDSTLAEIKRVTVQYPRKNVTCLVQGGKRRVMFL